MKFAHFQLSKGLWGCLLWGGLASDGSFCNHWIVFEMFLIVLTWFWIILKYFWQFLISFSRSKKKDLMILRSSNKFDNFWIYWFNNFELAFVNFTTFASFFRSFLFKIVDNKKFVSKNWNLKAIFQVKHGLKFRTMNSHQIKNQQKSDLKFKT